MRYKTKKNLQYKRGALSKEANVRLTVLHVQTDGRTTAEKPVLDRVILDVKRRIVGRACKGAASQLG